MFQKGKKGEGPLSKSASEMARMLPPSALNRVTEALTQADSGIIYTSGYAAACSPEGSSLLDPLLP